MRPGLAADAIVTDVSSIKAQVVRDVVPHLPAPAPVRARPSGRRHRAFRPRRRLRDAVRAPPLHPDADRGHRSRGGPPGSGAVGARRRERRPDDARASRPGAGDHLAPAAPDRLHDRRHRGRPRGRRRAPRCSSTPPAASPTSPASPPPTPPCGATCSSATARRCSRCWAASPRIWWRCSAPSAGATGEALFDLFTPHPRHPPRRHPGRPGLCPPARGRRRRAAERRGRRPRLVLRLRLLDVEPGLRARGLRARAARRAGAAACASTRTTIAAPPARPGLVLGLAAGRRAASAGRSASRASREPEVLAYLDARELLGAYVYDRVRLPVTLLAAGRTFAAWCYVARAGITSNMPATSTSASVLRHVRQGHGLAGACADYVRNTVAHLREMGIGEPELEALHGRARPRRTRARGRASAAAGTRPAVRRAANGRRPARWRPRPAAGTGAAPLARRVDIVGPLAAQAEDRAVVDAPGELVRKAGDLGQGAQQDGEVGLPSRRAAARGPGSAAGTRGSPVPARPPPTPRRLGRASRHGPRSMPSIARM